MRIPTSDTSEDRARLDAHPLPPGFSGFVVELDPVAGPSVVGLFTVESPVHQVPYLYRGRFAGDPKTKTREEYVFAEIQTDVEGFVSIMETVWLAGLKPKSVDDFYPDPF